MPKTSSHSEGHFRRNARAVAGLADLGGGSAPTQADDRSETFRKRSETHRGGQRITV